MVKPLWHVSLSTVTAAIAVIAVVALSVAFAGPLSHAAQNAWASYVALGFRVSAEEYLVPDFTSVGHHAAALVAQLAVPLAGITGT
jgi:hypothetical protein